MNEAKRSGAKGRGSPPESEASANAPQQKAKKAIANASEASHPNRAPSKPCAKRSEAKPRGTSLDAKVESGQQVRRVGSRQARWVVRRVGSRQARWVSRLAHRRFSYNLRTTTSVGQVGSTAAKDLEMNTARLATRADWLLRMLLKSCGLLR